MRCDRARLRLGLVGLGLGLFLLACQGEDTLDGHSCPTSSTTTSASSSPTASTTALTYDNFGQDFFDTWCQSCHAANQTNRNGAPDDIFFDTRDDIYRLRTQVYAQAAGTNASMPIGPHGPSDSEREKLADWLACGAP